MQARGEKIPSLLRSTRQKAPAILWTRDWWEVKKEGQKQKLLSQRGGKHVSQGPGEGAWASDADVYERGCPSGDAHCSYHPLQETSVQNPGYAPSHEWEGNFPCWGLPAKVSLGEAWKITYLCDWTPQVVSVIYKNHWETMWKMNLMKRIQWRGDR